jgi:uncharacterized protein (DUF1810 family)
MGEVLQKGYDLERFVEAQKGAYEQVTRELRAGRKRNHWMWFIFPQIAGLGHSEMAQRYAISSLAEAAAYLKHPLLGPRLRECAQLVVDIEGRSIDQILEYPDDLKFRSSMTLFAHAGADERVFQEAMGKYFGGVEDPLTLERL